MTATRSAAQLLIPAVLLIAGCGGSGGSSNDPAPQQDLHSARAPAQPMDVSSTTLTATDSSGNTWSAVFSSAAGAMAMFNGQNASTSMIALTVSENGTVVSTEADTAYYLTNPYSPLGVSGTTSGTAWSATINGYTPLPTTLSVGDSGPVESATYTDGVGNNIGSITETYTVTADSPTALFLNINAAGTVNGVQESETLTYAIGSDGTLQALVQAQITVNGTTITFQ